MTKIKTIKSTNNEMIKYFRILQNKDTKKKSEVKYTSHACLDNITDNETTRTWIALQLRHNI